MAFKELRKVPLPPAGDGWYAPVSGMYEFQGRLTWLWKDDWVSLVGPITPANDNYPATDWREADPDDVEELDEAA